MEDIITGSGDLSNVSAIDIGFLPGPDDSVKDRFHPSGYTSGHNFV